MKQRIRDIWLELRIWWARQQMFAARSGGAANKAIRRVRSLVQDRRPEQAERIKRKEVAR